MKIVGQLVGHSRRTQTPILRLVSISEFVRQEPLGLPLSDEARDYMRARYGLGPYPRKQKQLEGVR